MKAFLTISLLCCFWPFLSQSQTVIMYDGQGNVIGGNHIKSMPPHEIILKDSVTDVKFVLDSTHVYITAYDKSGKVLWKTDPWKDNNIEVYRTSRPIIVDMKLDDAPDYPPGNKKKLGKVVWIRYINTQFGYVESKTGAYHFGGQD